MKVSLSSVLVIGAVIWTATYLVMLEDNRDVNGVEKVKKMEHKYASVFCVRGFQAYRMGVNSGNAWLWVPNKVNSSFKIPCDLNTSVNGKQISTNSNTNSNSSTNTSNSND